MNFVEDFFENNGETLTRVLQCVGFTDEQLDVFLPEAASAILRSFYHKEIEMIIAAMNSDDPAQLVESVRIYAIVDKTAIDARQVALGIRAIAPLMMQAFTDARDGVVVTAASIAWGGRLNFSKKPDA